MTTSVQSIITKVQELLQDKLGIRWPVAHLVAHINDGQREIATLRPDLFVVTVSISITGVKHTIPGAAVNPIEIVRNTNGAAIRQTDRNMLDAVEPGWYSKTPSKVIKHFCYDSREPDVFYTYPPAAAGASVDAVYSTLPADATLDGNINCKDTCATPLMHFCLFRAYMKDAEFGGNAALSASHYQLFKAGLSDDASTGQAIKPTTTN